LSPPIAALLGALGVRPAAPAVDLADVRVPASQLPVEARQALAAVVGAANVLTGREARARHGAGKSTADLVRQRVGDAAGAPDAVVYPGCHDEVVAVLRACTEQRIAVVPFGGGTSVVGGVGPALSGRPRIALDLRRLDQLVELDTVSRTATFEAGVRAPRAEEILAEQGFTLGHVPQSYEYASLGGFAATRSSGQASAGYGRFDDMVVALTVATPAGTVHTGRAPASAAGPDLRQLFLGSEGALGVVTSLTLRLRPQPVGRRYEAWRFESFEAGALAVRRLAQDGPCPTVVRLSDEYESALGPAAGGCLLVLGYDNSTRADAVLAAAGATALGPEPGQRWAAERFAAPYLRDALLDAGAYAETLETATFWSRLPALYAQVRAALLDSLDRALVLCHISHVYETGASLYFTVVVAQDDDPVGAWPRAKARASDAILAAGGTISHHHGVGTVHRDWYAREIGPLGVDALRAVKAVLDPHGVMNPGVLIPD
jgi:alkyldihydroxyacetonephosphate synthase